jgi:hypothetical protein
MCGEPRRCAVPHDATPVSTPGVTSEVCAGSSDGGSVTHKVNHPYRYSGWVGSATGTTRSAGGLRKSHGSSDFHVAVLPAVVMNSAVVLQSHGG